MNKKHQKHAFLEKPSGGQYHFNEWTLIGAPCSMILELVLKISQQLKDQDIKVGYLDMQHNAEEMSEVLELIMIDKINCHQLVFKGSVHQRDYRKYFQKLDLLFVNGNHFKGKKQIAIINEAKKESLGRKMDRLDEIKMVILDKDKETVHDYLESIVQEETPTFKIDSINEISAHLAKKLEKNIPNLNGLVLAGGLSSRMGEDKGKIKYHDKGQREYEADLLSSFCAETYISFSEAKTSPDDSVYQIISDSFLKLGPYGGILSAFRHQPKAAWLTVACDLPYINQETIEQLVNSRNPKKLATCFYNPETEFPEPLITIWEPRAYPVLLDFLSQGYSCPRKVLINSDIEMIEMKDVIRMKNSNTPEERDKAISFIHKERKID